MTDEELAAIARGLSEAQREILLNEAWCGPHGWRLKRVRTWTYTLGVTEPGSSSLTPFGIAVRAYLEKAHG